MRVEDIREQQLAVMAERDVPMAETMEFRISKGAYQWMRSGDRGLSSNFMFECATGVPMNEGHWGGRPHYPHDPSDLLRCIRLVDAAPEVRDAFPKIAKSHPVWARLIEHWDELVALLQSEIGEDYSGDMAKETYAAMKEHERIVREGSE